VFSYYNTCLAEGIIPSGNTSDSAFRKARKRWLIGYDRQVERMRQADHCIGCDHCLPHCPQRIHIPEEMQRIDDFVEQLKQS
jgi:hypothetical protein